MTISSPAAMTVDAFAARLAARTTVAGRAARSGRRFPTDAWLVVRFRRRLLIRLVVAAITFRQPRLHHRLVDHVTRHRIPAMIEQIKTN
jgi:uncharacterized protein (DUF2461 family)